MDQTLNMWPSASTTDWLAVSMADESGHSLNAEVEMRVVDEMVREDVLQQLKEYKANKQRMEALRYELKHFDEVTPEDTIAAMSFAHGGDGGRSPAGHISDKTQYIALHYQNRTYELNRRSKADILDEYMPIAQAVERLEHFISLLNPREAEVLYLRYRDQKKFAEIATEMQLSPKSVSNIRKTAVAKLCEMFALRIGSGHP